MEGVKQLTKQNKDTELVQICVPTKKINLEVSDTEKLEIILRPFKQRHFGAAIAIINKYFDKLNSVKTKYLAGRKAILEQYPEDSSENIRAETLANYDAGFDEGMEIAKAILTGGGEDIGEDLKSVISMSIYKSTVVVKNDNQTERSPLDPDLDDLTWGECLVLLGSVVGLNIDFFNQNSKAMNLVAVINKDEPSPKSKHSAGVKSSPDSSTAVIATAK